MKRHFLLLIGCVLLLCLPSQAAIVAFDLVWSGAPYENNASAVGRITIDDAILMAALTQTTIDQSQVVDFWITISGASAGNGTFVLADFDEFVFSSNGAVLDFTRELVGQPTTGAPWGTSDPDNPGIGGDFNAFGAGGSAPYGTWYFELTTDNSDGDPMLLTSFRAVPEPASFLLVGLGLLAVARLRRRA